MKKILQRLRISKITWQMVLAESLLFLAVFLVWTGFRLGGAEQGFILGHLFVFIPLMAVSLDVVLIQANIPRAMKWAWAAIGAAFLLLAVGRFLHFFIELGKLLPGMQISSASIPKIAAYPFFFLALAFVPFENRYAPSRFRFLLDATIMSGATIALGLLVFPLQADLKDLEFLALAFPILDLVLLVLGSNVFLANKRYRNLTGLFSIAFVFFLISDYFAYISTFSEGYQAGSLRDLGWIIGSLLFGLGAVIAGEPTLGHGDVSEKTEIGLRLQNLLPVAMVLVLFWYILARWQLSGNLSLFGLIMSLLLALLLIVRVGVRAGEGELLIYWQLFRNIATPVFLCTGVGKIILVNPAALAEMRVNDDKTILGRDLTSLFSAQPALQAMLSSLEVGQLMVNTELRFPKIPFALMMSPIFSEGRKKLVAVTAYNLTEQKRHQDVLAEANLELKNVSNRLEQLNVELESRVDERTRHLQRALRQLEEQNKLLRDLDQMKSEFVSLVSHELRTPLTSLQGGLELLLRRRTLPLKIRDPLSLMKVEVERLSRFVINILDISSVEAGKLQVHLKPVKIQSLIDGLLRELAAVPGSSRIIAAVDPRLETAWADEEILHSVLLHLLDNALKYAPEGEIMLKTIAEKNRIRFQIIDAGPGISEEKRHLLFRRFQRINPSDAQSIYGYGLGLYFSRKMIAAMNGKLTYSKLPDGRSCFQFRLESVDEKEDPSHR